MCLDNWVLVNVSVSEKKNQPQHSLHRSGAFSTLYTTTCCTGLHLKASQTQRLSWRTAEWPLGTTTLIVCSHVKDHTRANERIHNAASDQVICHQWTHGSWMLKVAVGLPYRWAAWFLFNSCWTVTWHPDALKLLTHLLIASLSAARGNDCQSRGCLSQQHSTAHFHTNVDWH